MYTNYFRCLECKAYFRITTNLTYKENMDEVRCPYCGEDVDYATDEQIDILESK